MVNEVLGFIHIERKHAGFVAELASILRFRAIGAGDHDHSHKPQ